MAMLPLTAFCPGLSEELGSSKPLYCVKTLCAEKSPHCLFSFTLESPAGPLPQLTFTSPDTGQGHACPCPLALPTYPRLHLPLLQAWARFSVLSSGLRGSFCTCPQLLLSLWERRLAECRENNKTGGAARDGRLAGPGG